MRTITNNYRDAQILNLRSGGERGPYLVTQRASRQPIPYAKETMFVPSGWTLGRFQCLCLLR
jgi:hypothetical protein